MAKFAYDSKYEEVFQTLFGAKTVEELRKLARPFMLQYHPDRNKSPDAGEAMIALNAILSKVTAGIVSGYRATFNKQRAESAAAKGYTYTPNPAKDADADAKLRDFILKLLAMDLQGIVVEICGVWAWISGDTKPHAQTLKSLGMLWSGSKQEWYFNGDPKKRFYGAPKTKEYIRARHGSEVVSDTRK